MKELCTIVGVGPGLGFALARRFSKQYDIAMIARNKEHLQEYEHILPNTKGFVCDVQDKELFEHTLQQIQLSRETQVLIYNVAIVEKNDLTVSRERAYDHLTVGILGAITAVQNVLPHMQQRKKGTILFTGGGFGVNPHPNYLMLSIVKAGIRNLTYSLAEELAPQGIHVGTVTIDGKIKERTSLDPSLLAEEFWRLHTEPHGSWRTEVYKR